MEGFCGCASVKNYGRNGEWGRENLLPGEDILI